MDTEPKWVHNDQGDRSASIIQIENGKAVAAVAICAALAGMAAVYAWHADQTARDAIVQYQVMLNHQMYLENQVENVKEKLK